MSQPAKGAADKEYNQPETIQPNKFVRLVSTWKASRMVAVIIVLSVTTSFTASMLFSVVFGIALTTKSILRAIIIPLSIAIVMGTLWVQFVQYLRQTQDALRASETKNRAILQTLPDLMFTIDRDGRFLDYHAPHIQELLEPPGIFIGKKVHNIFDQKLADDALVYAEQALDTGNVSSLEYRLVRGDTPHFYEARFVALDNDIALTLVRDITARKQAEAALVAERASLAQRVEERTATLRETNNQLVAALRTRDEFLALVSHELRTPLTAILAFADLMYRKIYGPTTDRQQQALVDMKSSGEHLLAIINDVLDYSRLETGELVLDIEALDVAKVCQSSLKLVEHKAEQKHIELVTDIDPRVITVPADARRMRQMLVNLFDNALKFTPVNGTVGLEVHGDVETHTVRFTVWDTGIGIAQDDIERIFQPFVQIDSRLARQYEGAGLGLALVYFLVDLHGGAVSVTSEIGVGSRFTLTLPWQPTDTYSESQTTIQNVGPAFAPAVVSAMHAHKLILVAEDNRLSSKVLCELLTNAGYRVITAQDGTAAVQATREHHLDLILMDIQMPGMDGLEAMRLIRADVALCDIPIIAVTALAMPGDRDRCVAAGATDYLSKPIDAQHLLNATRKALMPEMDSEHTRASG